MAQNISATSQDTSLTPSYTVDFDLRDMKGFNDNIIGGDDIEAFIRERAPNSPMLNETNIGKCSINAGLNNSVNPAFLIAVAYMESGFGTLGWAKWHPECNNAFSYSVLLGNESSDQYNCASSWCKMANRATSDIANGNSYYEQNLFTISQVCAKYPGNLNPDNIANLMNELFSLSISRNTTPEDSSVIVPNDAISPNNNLQQLPKTNLMTGLDTTYFGVDPHAANFIPEASLMTGLGDVIAWCNKGYALISQGKYDEAIKAYDEAIRLNPNLAAAWCNKGYACLGQYKYAEAIKAFDEAIRLNPNLAEAKQGADKAKQWSKQASNEALFQSFVNDRYHGSGLNFGSGPKLHSVFPTR